MLKPHKEVTNYVGLEMMNGMHVDTRMYGTMHESRFLSVCMHELGDVTTVCVEMRMSISATNIK